MIGNEPHFIENAREVLRLRAELERQQEAYAALQLQFEPLCPCQHNGASLDPKQGCPIHGDGVTFVEYVGALENAAKVAFGPNALDIVREVVAER